jgi:hypothetical protein
MRSIALPMIASMLQHSKSSRNMSTNGSWLLPKQQTKGVASFVIVVRLTSDLTNDCSQALGHPLVFDRTVGAEISINYSVPVILSFAVHSSVAIRFRKDLENLLS